MSVSSNSGAWHAIATAPKEAFTVVTQDFIDNLPFLAASIGIAVGGLLIAYIVLWIAEKFTRSESSKRFRRDHHGKGYYETNRKSRHAWIRLISMCLACVIAIGAFWIAAQAAGFNFWTVILGYGILSLVAANAFGQTLRDMGAFFLIALTDKIEDDWYIDVLGTGAQGRVDAIHLLWVELSVRDAENNQIKLFVPTGVIMSNIVRRIFKMEPETDKFENKSPLGIPTKPAAVVGSRIRPVGLLSQV